MQNAVVKNVVKMYMEENIGILKVVFVLYYQRKTASNNLEKRAE